MKEALVQRERMASALWQHERTLLDRRDQVRAELAATLERLEAVRPVLARYGRWTLEFADLRRTTRAREHPLRLPRLATGEESGADLTARLVAAR